MDCGPTCLQMIAAYYGKNYSLSLLRDKTHITKEGTSMLGICEAAEDIGFRVTGAYLSFEDLEEAVLPCIVYWGNSHYIVVYKIKKKKHETFFYVADPDLGRITYTKSEFEKNWMRFPVEEGLSGIALLLEPTPDFYKYEDEETLNHGFVFLFTYLKPYKNFILQLFLGLIFVSVVQLIFPFLTQSVVDFGIGTQNINFIYLVLIAQLVLILSTTSVDFIRGWILLHLGTRVNIALISDFLIKLMHMPMKYFEIKKIGDILQRINDHDRIQDFLTNSTLSALFSILNFVAFSVILLFYNLKIFLIFLAGCVLYFLWIWLFMKYRAELDNKTFAQLSNNQNSVVQIAIGMQEIKLDACEQPKRWKWEHIQAKIFRLRIKGLALGQYQDSGAVLINQVKNIMITAFVAQLVVEGKMTLGMMISVQYIIGQLNGPVEQIISFMRKTQDARLSLNRLSEIHSEVDEYAMDQEKLRKIPFDKPIRFKNVDFRYDTTSLGDPVIQNINLTIPPGLQTAIVGTSGSGKTTLIKLLLGFYPLQSGEILVGNVNLKNYSIREWRKQCGVVMQDGFIYSDTILRNIVPGIDPVDQIRLENAVDTANIKDFIDSLPLGYEAKIGSDGQGLSQGQKQRILIARAVYKNPQIVFFDEATNALDANNEKLIMNKLGNFFKGRTSIVVAHRLSTVRNADQIIVLEKGKIVEQGTHNELINKRGDYYKLVKNQLDL